jgi:hypothetical protein
LLLLVGGIPATQANSHLVGKQDFERRNIQQTLVRIWTGSSRLIVERRIKSSYLSTCRYPSPLHS